MRLTRHTKPLTNLGCVVGGAENELRGPVVTRANVRNIGLVLNQDLGTAKITQFQDAAAGIEQQVLRLNVAMADTLRVNVGQGSEELVGVQLDLEYWHGGLGLVEEPGGTINGFGNELLH